MPFEAVYAPFETIEAPGYFCFEAVYATFEAVHASIDPVEPPEYLVEQRRRVTLGFLEKLLYLGARDAAAP